MANYEVWPITTYKEYLESWPAIPGKFDKLTDYQKSLGYLTPEQFFQVQAYHAQELANQKVGNIIGRVFDVTDLSPLVQKQLRKFTYQCLDYLRMNDLVISEDVRLNQTAFNNGRTDSTQINIERIEQYVGSMAWRSWILANIQELYISWAKDNKIPWLLDPEKYYTKTEIDIKLTEIDDQIQVQQKMVDEKLKEFNKEMEKRLSEFTEELPDNQGFISKVSEKVAENPNIPTDQQIDNSLNRVLKDNYSLFQEDYIIVDEEELIKINWEKGPKGDTGPTGSQGPAGPKGDKGEDGTASDEQVTDSINQIFDDNFSLDENDFLLDEETKKIKINWPNLLKKIKEMK